MIFAAEEIKLTPVTPDSIVAWLAWFHSGYPLVGTLIILMGLDIVVGFAAAFITQTISSTICSRGMMKKVIIMMLVGMCAAIEPFTQGIPLSKLASMAFIVFECTSIVENAARAGLPIPKPILDALILLKGTDKEKAAVSQPPSQNVTINRTGSVDIHTDAPHIVTPAKTDSVVIRAKEVTVTPVMGDSSPDIGQVKI